MHASPDTAIPYSGPRADWFVPQALGVFALGIPLDVMLASRLGSSSLVLGAPLATVVAWRVITSSRIRSLPGPLLLMCAYVVWGAASVLWARETAPFQTWITTNAQLIAFVVLCWQVLDAPRAFSMMLTGYVAGCVVAGADVWRAYLSGEALTDQTNRFAADSYDPNDMGVTLAIGIPMAAYLAVSGGRRLRYAALAYLPLAISAIVLSGSRGASLAGLVSLMGVLLWFARRRRGAFVCLLALFALIAVFEWQSVPSDSLARILTLRDEVNDGTAGDRAFIWRAGLDLSLRHPLLGVGAGGFADSVVQLIGSRMAAHSTFLSVAVDLGVVGLLLYAGAFAAAIRGVARRSGDYAGFGVTLLATWFVGTASLSWEARKATWLVLLLCTTLASHRPPAESSNGRALP